MVRLLPKPGKNHETLKGWRPIAVGAVLSKLYELWVWRALDRSLRPLPPLIIGFVAGGQAHDIIGCLALALRRSTEWRRPLSVASLDVEAAFDKMRGVHVGRELRACGGSALLVHSIVDDMLAAVGKPCLGTVEGGVFAYQRGARQGAPRTPRLWNYMLARVLDQVGRRCREEAPAFPDAPELEPWSILVWADNIFVMATTAIALRRRVEALEAGLRGLDLTFSTSSLEQLRNPWFVQEGQLRLPLGDQSFRTVDLLPCLGVGLDAEASTLGMIRHRQAAAVRTWYRHRDALMGAGLPDGLRMRAFRGTVGASLLYGSAHWLPTLAARDELARAETRYLRMLTGLRKQEADSWMDFYSRRHRAVERLGRAAPDPLWGTALRFIHGWQGHMQRHQERPAGAALRWRGLTWWRTLQFLNLDVRTPVRHPSRGWTKDVEVWFEAALGRDYREMAADRELWRRSFDTFRDWDSERRA